MHPVGKKPSLNLMAQLGADVVGLNVQLLAFSAPVAQHRVLSVIDGVQGLNNNQLRAQRLRCGQHGVQCSPTIGVGNANGTIGYRIGIGQ